MCVDISIFKSTKATIPEILKDGENGYLVSKGDHQKLAEQILSLARNRDLRKKMAAANRRRYLDFYSPEKFADRMVAAFERMEQLT